MRNLLFLCGLFLAWPILASAGTLSDSQVKGIIAPLIDLEYAQGIVVGVIDDSGQRVLGFGRTSEQNSQVPDGKTVFEIGSITKVFTSLLLSDLTQRRMVRLDDSISQYLPDTVLLSQKERPITLLDLATHRSGLPRTPTNFGADHPEDPYATYTRQLLYSFLNNWRPSVAPGARAEYSNLGAGLLGHLLARRAGMSYDRLLKESLFDAMGMVDSTVNHKAETANRAATGHDPDGNVVPYWSFPDPFTGAGGICSTADDMLAFVKMQIQPPATPIGDAIRQSQVKQNKFDSANDIGLGWLISHDGYLWHNGQTGGFHSFVAFDPQKKVGIILLSNTTSDKIDPAGVQLIRLLRGETPLAAPNLRREIKLTDPQLARLTGDYVLGLAFLHIRQDGSRLYAQITGQPEYRIYPESPTQWFWKVTDAQFEFTFDPADPTRVQRLTLHQDGKSNPAPRLATTQPSQIE